MSIIIVLIMKCLALLIINNELVFKDSFNQTYKLKLSDRYRDIIYKKIMIYQRKKDELIKQK